MDAHIGSWFWRRKWVLAAVGLPVLIAAGGPSARRNCGSTKRSMSRPRSLQAPTLSRFIPGRLEGKAHQTSGRATIYKTADGKAVSSPDRFHDFEWPGCSRPSRAKR